VVTRKVVVLDHDVVSDLEYRFSRLKKFQSTLFIISIVVMVVGLVTMVNYMDVIINFLHVQLGLHETLATLIFIFIAIGVGFGLALPISHIVLGKVEEKLSERYVNVLEQNVKASVNNDRSFPTLKDDVNLILKVVNPQYEYVGILKTGKVEYIILKKVQ